MHVVKNTPESEHVIFKYFPEDDMLIYQVQLCDPHLYYCLTDAYVYGNHMYWVNGSWRMAGECMLPAVPGTNSYLCICTCIAVEGVVGFALCLLLSYSMIVQHYTMPVEREKLKLSSSY